jgi:molecular chaperone DnaJ
MEAALGCSKEITVHRRDHCQTCTGSGLKEGAKASQCGTCGGRGEVIQAQGFLRIRTHCPTCQGKGTNVAAADRCAACAGSGRVRSSEKLNVTIPAGVDNGMQLRLLGKGEAGDPGGPPGNLFVTIIVAEHSLFKREGIDTWCRIDVPFPVMVLGGEITVPTIHGEESLHIPAGTESGKVFTLRGKGIPRTGGRGPHGEHHVQVVVEVPKSVTSEQEALIRKLGDTQGAGVQEKGFWSKLFGG